MSTKQTASGSHASAGTTTVNGTEYTFTDEGAGPLLIFGHGLYANRSMFAEQILALRSRYRVVSIDWPGHGGTGDVPSSEWTLDRLVEDAVALVDRVSGDRPPVLVGHSLGAMVFMRLAARYPERVRGLALINASAGAEPEERRPAWKTMQRRLRAGGEDEVRAVIEEVQKKQFSAAWLARNPCRAARLREQMLQNDPAQMAQAVQAIVLDRGDVRRELSHIEVPTLVVNGANDHATPPERGREIAGAISDATFSAVQEAGHHVPEEAPAVLNGLLLELLEEAVGAAPGPSDASGERWHRGWQKLKEIDGEAGERVVESLRAVAPDLARYVVEFPFGDVYSRDGLDLRAREIAAVAALSTLGHARPQLKVHIHGALNVGCTREEVIEVIIQTAVYAGFPAALNGAAVAAEVFSERET